MVAESALTARAKQVTGVLWCHRQGGDAVAGSVGQAADGARRVQRGGGDEGSLDRGPVPRGRRGPRGDEEAPGTLDCHSVAYEDAVSEKVDQLGVGWATTAGGIGREQAHQEVPGWGVIEGAVGVVLVPHVRRSWSRCAAMPVTSATTMWPSTAPARVAVTGVEPDVPLDPNPTHTSAVPLDDWMDADDLLPGHTPARHPGRLEARSRSSPRRRSRSGRPAASPALTPWGRVTDQELWAEKAPWFSWRRSGRPRPEPALSASIVTSIGRRR